jgi:hypothetical protein
LLIFQLLNVALGSLAVVPPAMFLVPPFLIKAFKISMPKEDLRKKVLRFSIPVALIAGYSLGFYKQNKKILKNKLYSFVSKKSEKR